MATGNAVKFGEFGVPIPLAKELARQITASTGTFEKLRELGVPAAASKIMAASVVSHTVSNKALVEAGIVPPLVREFARQIAT